MYFSTINEVILLFKEDEKKYEIIYKEFEKNANSNTIIKNQFINCDGFGELAFSWNWYLLVNDMPTDFSFLEIGVYKGRVLALIQMLSSVMNKNSTIYGVTPLSTAGDKYSIYLDVEYLNEIKRNFSLSNATFDNTMIIKGFSQDINTINTVNKYKQFNIIFIDGCHDYDIVCKDIDNYLPMLKNGGYLVMDDASLLLENAYGKFLGHMDVAKAIHDKININKNLIHLYAIGHNRIWQYIIN
jgi:hypothetical protein